MADLLNANDFSRFKNKKIFFDTNIWMYIFCEIANSQEYFVNKYSTIFNNLLKSKTLIFVDFAVISEFVNSYLRISFNNYNRKNKLKNQDYKRDYRKTDDFREAWENVCNIVNNKILSIAKTINFEYNKISIKGLLNSKNLETDFNDNHIVNLCKTNNIYLLTNDGDFKDADINIITANSFFWK